MRMNFEDYCEEYLDLDIALMSSEQKEDAFTGFISRPAKAEKHTDSKMTMNALRAKCARLVNSQKISIERSNLINETAIASVKFGESLLTTKKVSKTSFHAHTDMNSEASRIFNNAR